MTVIKYHLRNQEHQRWFALISLVDLKIENRIHKKMELVLMIVTSVNGRTKTQVFEEYIVSSNHHKKEKPQWFHKMDRTLLKIVAVLAKLAKTKEAYQRKLPSLKPTKLLLK